MANYIIVDKAGNETVVKDVIHSFCENRVLVLHPSNDAICYFNMDEIVSAVEAKDG